MGVLTSNIARQLRAVHTGGSWTTTSLQQMLEGLTFEQACQQNDHSNNIATLVYHTHYYVAVAVHYFETGKLEGKDALSFNLPPLNGQNDWEAFLAHVFHTAERLAVLIEELPDERLTAVFSDEKYGTYFRNLEGTIEHLYYHLGQISILRKEFAK